MERPIALVVALALERRALQRLLVSARIWRADEFRGVTGRLAQQSIVLIQAGIGRERARRALLAACQRLPLRAVWSLGFSGGLADGLRPGDLVCPRLVVTGDAGAGQAPSPAPDRAAVLAALAAAGLPLSDGPLLSVDSPLRTPEVKRAAHRRTGAVAVDMEAAGVAEAAESLGIPWLAMKSVVDAAEEPLPGFLAGCATGRGDIRWRGVLSCLVTGGRRRALGRVARASRLAALALCRGVEVAVPAWSP